MEALKEIRMVDLKTQYESIKTEVNDAIQEVLDSTQFIKGPQVKSFEQNLAAYLKCNQVVSCANGTDALQIAMMALNYQPGDEIITSSFTYVATAEVIALLKLTPVLVDVNPDTFTIDPSAIEKAITAKTKAIVPVHLFGQCAHMEPIIDIAQKHGLDVIEDNAQAIGATYYFANGKKQKSGTIGTVGTTSFFPSKNLGCYGDGGAMNTNNDSLADKLRKIANHGQDKLYVHDEVGVNSRLDSIQAAILNIKLKYLDTYISKRQQAAAFYNSIFGNHEQIITPVKAAWSTHVYHQYTIKLNNVNRDKLRQQLANKGIPTMVYYPIPLHMQKAYADSRYAEGMFPVTENLCKSVLSLPMHTELTQNELTYIAETVIKEIKTAN